MLRAIARSVKHQDGQAMVELALLLPIVLLVLFGITEFGRGLAAYLALSHATREGARQAALGATDADVERTVQDCASGLELASLSVLVSPAESSRTTGATVTVTANYSFKIVVPVISSVTGPSIPMSAALSMRVE